MQALWSKKAEEAEPEYAEFILVTTDRLEALEELLEADKTGAELTSLRVAVGEMKGQLGSAYDELFAKLNAKVRPLSLARPSRSKRSPRFRITAVTATPTPQHLDYLNAHSTLYCFSRSLPGQVDANTETVTGLAVITADLNHHLPPPLSS